MTSFPKMIKGGGDGVVGPAMLTAVGYPANEGWYGTIASPHVVGDQKAQQFVDAYFKKYDKAADDYAITAYDAALVLIDAIKRVAASGQPVTREAVRDAIQSSNVPTIQGVVSSTRTVTSRTVPSACSRSSRTRTHGRTMYRGNTTTLAWRRSREAAGVITSWISSGACWTRGFLSRVASARRRMSRLGPGESMKLPLRSRPE